MCRARTAPSCPRTMQHPPNQIQQQPAAAAPAWGWLYLKHSSSSSSSSNNNSNSNSISSRCSHPNHRLHSRACRRCSSLNPCSGHSSSNISSTAPFYRRCLQSSKNDHPRSRQHSQCGRWASRLKLLRQLSSVCPKSAKSQMIPSQRQSSGFMHPYLLSHMLRRVLEARLGATRPNNTTGSKSCL